MEPERDRIRAFALLALSDLSASSKRETASIIDYETAINWLLEHPNATVLHNRWFVVYDVATPWFSCKPVLQEHIVLRVDAGGSFSEVSDFLLSTAKANGCAAIMAGTFLARNDAQVAALYRRHGSSQAAVAMIRRLECVSD